MLTVICKCGQPDEVHLVSMLGTATDGGVSQVEHHISGCNGFVIKTSMLTMKILADYFIDRKDVISQIDGGDKVIELANLINEYYDMYSHDIDIEHIGINQDIEMKDRPLEIQMIQKFKEFLDDGINENQVTLRVEDRSGELVVVASKTRVEKVTVGPVVDLDNGDVEVGV